MRPFSSIPLRLGIAAAAGIVLAVSALSLGGGIAKADPLDGPFGQTSCGVGRGNSVYSGPGVTWDVPSSSGFVCALQRESGPKKHRIETFDFLGGDSLLILSGNLGGWINFAPPDSY